MPQPDGLHFLIPTGPDDSTVVYPLDYVPSSITVNTGTPTGSVTDVQTMFDGNTLDIAEVTGTPGFDVEFSFTGLADFPDFVVARWQYDGSSTHFCTIDIWNYTTKNSKN